MVNGVCGCGFVGVFFWFCFLFFVLVVVAFWFCFFAYRLSSENVVQITNACYFLKGNCS